MAPEDNWKKIKEKRDREDQVDSGIRLPAKEFRKPEFEKPGEGMLLLLIERAEPMIEQINSLYHQYFVGVEKRPPAEARRQLEALVKQIASGTKLTAQEKFRYQSFQTHVQTFFEKWDREIKKFDSTPRAKKAK